MSATRRLHLGCGTTHRDGWINIDREPGPAVDLVRDVLRGLPYADNTVDEVASENFIEHLPPGWDGAIWVMNELWRVCKPGGSALHLVPEAGSPNDFGDPTHLAHWSQETLTYFQQGHRRNDYYGGRIKPWLVTVESININKVMFVRMVKPA